MELLNMKKILQIGLIITSLLSIIGCKKDVCNKNILDKHYNNIDSLYIDSFKLNTTKNISLKKYKSDSTMNFRFIGETSDYIVLNSYPSYTRCNDTDRVYYNQMITYSYISDNYEELSIMQDPTNVYVFFRNSTFYFSNKAFVTNRYQYDSITLSGNKFYNAFESSYLDRSCYYNFEFGLLRLRPSLNDIWDIKL